MTPSSRIRSLGWRTGLYGTVGLVCLLAILPIAWSLLTSFKTQQEVFSFPPTFLPERLRIENYTEIFGASQYAAFAVNSVVVASLATVGTMVLASLAGYAFSVFRFPGNATWMLLILITRMIPGIAIVIPLYIMAQRLGLFDTRLNLIILYMTTTLPLAIWLLKASFDTIPQDLLDAARIDGCGNLRTLVRVVVPVAAPGIVTTLVITFLANWNEFLLAQIFTATTASKTLPVAVGELTQHEYGIHWGNLSAMGMAIVFPTLILAVFIQRYVVSGLMAGSMK